MHTSADADGTSRCPPPVLRRLFGMDAKEYQEMLKHASPPALSDHEAWRATERGLTADVVLVYKLPSLDSSGATEAPDRGETLSRRTTAEERLFKVESMVKRLRDNGLFVSEYHSPKGHSFLKVTSPFDKLMEAAERGGVDMQLEGSDDFGVFKAAEHAKFARKNGRLFTAALRQRLILDIMETSTEQGGCEIDPDKLVADGVLLTYFPSPSHELEYLIEEWLSVRLYPCSSVAGVRRRMWPDFGLLQQPLHRVRDYYGEKIAFYFAWMEHNTEFLFLLMWLGILHYILIECRDTSGATQALSTPLTCLIIAVWTTAFHEAWKRREAVLRHHWQMEDFEDNERPRPAFLTSFSSGPWRYRPHGTGSMVRKLRGFYHDRVFVQCQDATHMLVMDAGARRRVVCMGAPLLLLLAALMLVVTFAILAFRMLMTVAVQFEHNGTFNPGTAATWGGILNTVWITVMNFSYSRLAVYLNDLENHRTETEYEDMLILKMFLFQAANSYAALFYIAFVKGLGASPFNAFGLTDLDGDPYRDMCGVRTGEWFTAVACEVPPQQQTGFVDGNTSACRYVLVNTSCMADLRTQMFFYTVVRPLYEVPLQALLPWLTGTAIPRLTRWFAKKRSGGSTPADNQRDPHHAHHHTDVDADAGAGDGVVGRGGVKAVASLEEQSLLVDASTARCEELKRKLHAELEEQFTRPVFGGTVSEYNSKAVQYGYVALFAAAFPLCTLAAAVTNFFELRVDAFKLSRVMRRPFSWGAQDIGTWAKVLASLSWLALLVNTVLAGFTDWTLRDELIIPFLARGSVCDHAYTYPPAINRSWSDDCERNVRDCFENIGGVDWLPASTFLEPDASTTKLFTRDGLCSHSGEGQLYDEALCEWCTARTSAAFLLQAIFVFVVEHALLLIKLVLAWAVPDVPTYIIRKRALRKFEHGGFPAARYRSTRTEATSESASLLAGGDDDDGDDAPPGAVVRV